MKNPLIKIGLVVFLVLALTISAFALWGVFDLTGYNSNTVNSVMAGKNLNQIYSYMASNFTWRNYLTARSPYTVYTSKNGDCNDFATYGIYCAYKNGVYSKVHLRQIWIVYAGGQHMLALYSCYYYGDDMTLRSGLWSPRAACENWAARSGATLYSARIYNYDCDLIGNLSW